MRFRGFAASEEDLGHDQLTSPAANCAFHQSGTSRIGTSIARQAIAVEPLIELIVPQQRGISECEVLVEELRHEPH